MVFLRIAAIYALVTSARAVGDGDLVFAAFMAFLAIMASVNAVILSAGLRQDT
jgi:hypothetical protein